MLWCFMLTCVVFSVFFFKQKTAYEMRISDWSSDVCSSDLWQSSPHSRYHQPFYPFLLLQRLGGHQPLFWALLFRVLLFRVLLFRSEEHTSELQSLMRISYAVFCLKNKKTIIYTTNRTTHKRCKTTTISM